LKQQSDRVSQLERENQGLRGIPRKAMAWFARVNACSTGKAKGPYVLEGRLPD
jgi:hypothetical protein